MDGLPVQVDADAVRALVGARARRGGPDVRDGDRLSADLGYDSMLKLELAAALEDTLGRPVADDVVTRSATVGDVLAALARG